MESLRTGDKNSIKAIVNAYVTAVEESDIFEKFENLTTNEIAYHNSCKTLYWTRGKPRVDTPESSWHTNRNFHRINIYI